MAEVIVDGIEETDEGPELIGHAWFQAPDSDGAVHLEVTDAAVGDGDADAVIVNTCSFLASATSESIETTLALAEDVAEGVRGTRIVMCGCVPSRYGSELPDELPEVAAFVRTDEEDGIVSVMDEVLGIERVDPPFIPSVKRTVESAVAYVKISDGCDRYCSFCAIPYIRGRYHSRSAESILSEVRDLVAGGVREIVLIGQDTGIWGTDFKGEVDGPTNLAQLMVAVAEAVRPEHVWIRVLYLQPEGMTDELTPATRDTPEVLPYVDIPAQLGAVAEVIVDGIEETDEGPELIGHAWFQAPDSDGAVHLEVTDAAVGDILQVKFTDSFCYELVGEVVEE